MEARKNIEIVSFSFPEFKENLHALTTSNDSKWRNSKQSNEKQRRKLILRKDLWQQAKSIQKRKKRKTSWIGYQYEIFSHPNSEFVFDV